MAWVSQCNCKLILKIMRWKSSKRIPIDKNSRHIKSISDKPSRLEKGSMHGNIINIRLKAIQWLNMDTLCDSDGGVHVNFFLATKISQMTEIRYNAPNQFLLNVRAHLRLQRSKRYSKRMKNIVSFSKKIITIIRDKTSSTISWLASSGLHLIWAGPKRALVQQLMNVTFQAMHFIVHGVWPKRHRLTLKFRYLSIKLAFVFATWSAACAA